MNEENTTEEDQTEVAEVATEVEPTEENTAPNAEADETATFDLQSVERIYFEPSKMGEASIAINTIIEGAGEDKVTFNFDPADADTIPAGFGLAIVPQTKRVDGQGVVCYGVTVAATPDPATVLANENGEKFVRDLVMGAMLAKIANSARVRADGSTGTLPVSIADFMERRAGRGEGLKTYTALASNFVKALRKKGLRLINSGVLRNCLQSSSFASDMFDKIEQEQWVSVIDLMLARAEAENLDPAILNDWKDKRDAFDIDTVDEVDFGDLGDLI